MVVHKVGLFVCAVWVASSTWVMVAVWRCSSVLGTSERRYVGQGMDSRAGGKGRKSAPPARRIRKREKRGAQKLTDHV